MLSNRSLSTDHYSDGEVSPCLLTPLNESLDDDVFRPCAAAVASTEQQDGGRRKVTVSRDLPTVDDESSESHNDDDDDVGTEAVANDSSVARHGRRNLYVTRRKTGSRLVLKNGVCNVSTRNVLHRKKRFLVDTFTTLIDMKWRYNIVMFCAAFVGSWCVFGVCWWSIAVVHGDHLYPNSTTWEPCVTGVYDFVTAFLFSVETQHTTGYGSRVIEPRCPHGIVLLMVQACCGIFIQSLMTGLIFSKLSRPKHRAHTMMFSRQAVVCLRDGQYCLLFRVADMRRACLVDTSVRALIVTERRTKDGRTIPLNQTPFRLETETNFNDGFVFLVWPITFVHRIVPGSPLYRLSAERLRLTDFEIIVILEGVVESTGYSSQIRTSYVPSEILWGHRLAPLVTYAKGDNGRYEIDFEQFHNVVPIASMPTCSAKEADEASAKRKDPSSSDDYPFSFTVNGGCRTSHQTSLMRLMSRRWRLKGTSGGGNSPSAKTTLPGYARKFERPLSVEVCSKARPSPPVLRPCKSQ